VSREREEQKLRHMTCKAFPESNQENKSLWICCKYLDVCKQRKNKKTRVKTQV